MRSATLWKPLQGPAVAQGHISVRRFARTYELPLGEGFEPGSTLAKLREQGPCLFMVNADALEPGEGETRFLRRTGGEDRWAEGRFIQEREPSNQGLLLLLRVECPLETEWAEVVNYSHTSPSNILQSLEVVRVEGPVGKPNRLRRIFEALIIIRTGGEIKVRYTAPGVVTQTIRYGGPNGLGKLTINLDGQILEIDALLEDDEERPALDEEAYY